jgi:hypothetical protein
LAQASFGSSLINYSLQRENFPGDVTGFKGYGKVYFWGRVKGVSGGKRIVGRNAFSHSTYEVEKSPKNKNPAQKGQGFF